MMADTQATTDSPRPRRGLTAKKKLLAGGALVLIALGYLIFTAFNGASSYYLTVSELKAQERAMLGQSVRLNGLVVSGSIVKGASGMDFEFAVADHVKPTDTYKVTFRGIPPDMFQDGVDVVAEGQLRPDGAFHATNLLTRCASKYEPDVNPGALSGQPQRPPSY